MSFSNRFLARLLDFQEFYFPSIGGLSYIVKCNFAKLTGIVFLTILFHFLLGNQCFAAQEVRLIKHLSSIVFQVTTKGIEYAGFSRTSNPIMVLVINENGYLIRDQSWRRDVLENRTPVYRTSPVGLNCSSGFYELDITPKSLRFDLQENTSYYALLVLKRRENGNFRLLFSNSLHFRVVGDGISILGSCEKENLPTKVLKIIDRVLDDVEAEDLTAYRTALKPRFIR